MLLLDGTSHNPACLDTDSHGEELAKDPDNKCHLDLLYHNLSTQMRKTATRASRRLANDISVKKLLQYLLPRRLVIQNRESR